MNGSKGRIAIVGAGPAGMAAALAGLRLGFDVTLFERAKEIRAAGNILNLWPPPQKVLKLIGVDTEDLGAPCHTYFENSKGKRRADVQLPAEVEAEYGGGFIGLLRWGLYQRMIDAIPPGVVKLDHQLSHIEDKGDFVRLKFANGLSHDADVLIGADGINSFVRKHLWGDKPIRHQRLHLVGGYLFLDEEPQGVGILAHNRTTQVSYTPIRHEGKWGYEWWVLEACDPGAAPPEDLIGFCRTRAKGFSKTVRDLIEATPLEHMQRWEIRDRPPLKAWSKGRVTLVGDAAHPTSPYAAYGAGMSIEDGYFLARELDAVSMSDTAAVRSALVAFETRRIPHTVQITQGAYFTGKIFHHCPAFLRPLRDWVFDNTPFLQKMVGDEMPAHILSQLAEIEDGEPYVPVHKRVKEPAL
ncbi:NAD(P)/FAD-dependent oxidoreductase [Novosphingobium sp. PP1Y]|uniref:FAD-dependent oxidoreductase n=1 Tax=Novosphingobium sp. PP1Y TaxID=702113 RepID=UPI0002DBAC19|nr:NAD(P)/FAD-dependent oxidoreductase [Novosphingobium sp. PP1Y]